MFTLETNRALLKLTTLVGALLLSLGLSGCYVHSKSASTSTTLVDYLSTTKDNEGFGPDKIFGIVSITADSKIYQVGSNGSLTGMFSAASDDRDFYQDSQRVLDRSIPVIVKTMARTNQYVLMPPESVLSDRVYVGVTAEENSAFNHTNVANGYKRISKERRMAVMAQNMGLDGVMHVNVSYGYSNEGTNIGGLVDYGKNYATVKINVKAVDFRGNVIWKASEASLSSRPISAESEFGSAADFKKLEPHLMESLRTTLGKVMTDLESDQS